MSPEINGHHLEHYGKRNNLEITKIPDGISEKKKTGMKSNPSS